MICTAVATLTSHQLRVQGCPSVFLLTYMHVGNFTYLMCIRHASCRYSIQWRSSNTLSRETTGGQHTCITPHCAFFLQTYQSARGHFEIDNDFGPCSWDLFKIQVRTDGAFSYTHLEIYFFKFPVKTDGAFSYTFAKFSGRYKGFNYRVILGGNFFYFLGGPKLGGVVLNWTSPPFLIFGRGTWGWHFSFRLQKVF
jgi:hypothetical protein